MKRENLWIGVIIFAACLGHAIMGSFFLHTFYRDDNVVSFAPLIIDAARQVVEGRIPWNTLYVGGGGGSPIIAALQPGVLNPLTLIPGIIWGHDPEIMVNMIVSLHIALFSVGAWFLSWALRAPPWSGFVASISLGFSGYYWVWAANWMPMTVPYAFLPWIIGATVYLGWATTSRQIVASQLICAASVYGLFFSGGPNPALYGMIVFVACLCSLASTASKEGVNIWVRLIPQAVFFCIVVAPLLLQSVRVFRYFEGRFTPFDVWSWFSVPLTAYAALWLPQSFSTWNVFGRTLFMDNVILSTGVVPCWYVVTGMILRPSQLAKRELLPLGIGIVVFIFVLSPHLLPNAPSLASLVFINAFRWPFRAVPAFQVLLIFLFLVWARAWQRPAGRWSQMLVVLACLVFSLLPIYAEMFSIFAVKPSDNWFRVGPSFANRESWDKSTLERLRSAGYVATLCKTYPLYCTQSRLFFHGNLGAQYSVHTVGSYLFNANTPLRASIGMDDRGRFTNWKEALRFIRLSAPRPLKERVGWKNGIGPTDLKEFTSKTYVGAVVVEKSWREPIAYFVRSDEWRLLDEKPTVAVFVRSKMPRPEVRNSLNKRSSALRSYGRGSARAEISPSGSSPEPL